MATQGSDTFSRANTGTTGFLWGNASDGQTASGNRVSPQMQALMANVMQQLPAGTWTKAFSNVGAHA